MHSAHRHCHSFSLPCRSFCSPALWHAHAPPQTLAQPILHKLRSAEQLAAEWNTLRAGVPGSYAVLSCLLDTAPRTDSAPNSATPARLLPGRALGRTASAASSRDADPASASASTTGRFGRPHSVGPVPLSMSYVPVAAEDGSVYSGRSRGASVIAKTRGSVKTQGPGAEGSGTIRPNSSASRVMPDQGLYDTADTLTGSPEGTSPKRSGFHALRDGLVALGMSVATGESLSVTGATVYSSRGGGGGALDTQVRHTSRGLVHWLCCGLCRSCLIRLAVQVVVQAAVHPKR